MAIVRKTVIYGTERTEGSTIIGVAVIDYNEADPSASQQVGQSLTIEVEDNPEDNLEAWFDGLLTDAREVILQSVVTDDLKLIAERKMARHG